MAPARSESASLAPGSSVRRVDVLNSALATFARFGYRRTAMDEVARAADISRPGLYFLFSSKQALFKDAVLQTLEHDLDAAERALADHGVPLAERLLVAFDHWAGRYVEPPAREVIAVIEANPELLGDLPETARTRFEALIDGAVTAEHLDDAAAITQTLISTSIGIKQQTDRRAGYRAKMQVAVRLLLAGQA